MPSGNAFSDPEQNPDWAIEKARASLQLGRSVQETENILVAYGLKPEAATAVVLGVLEEKVRRKFRSLEQTDEQDRLHRILSGIVACVCVGLGYWFGAGYSAMRTLISVVLPLACISFPEYLASATQRPFIRWAGWFALVLIAGYRILLLCVAS